MLDVFELITGQSPEGEEVSEGQVEDLPRNPEDPMITYRQLTTLRRTRLEIENLKLQPQGFSYHGGSRINNNS